MDLSIVIPSYDSAARLKQTLDVIACQREVPRSRVQTIVVDDGSTDDTRSVVRNAKGATVDYVYRERNSRSCRALARNLGIRAATGDTLLFLDAGVLPGPGLLSRAVTMELQGALVIYETLGLFADPADSPVDLTSPSILAALPRLRELRAWADVRQPYMTAHEAGARLAAPWLMAWTCALSVPRIAALGVAGFDDRFAGWGAEDIDFAARVMAWGAELSWCGEEGTALHIPHAKSRERRDDHRQNATLLHAKLKTRESELFALWNDAFAVNLFADRLDGLALECLVPTVHFSRHDVRVPADARVICSGVTHTARLAPFAPAVALAHDAASAARLAALWPTAEVRRLVGVHTLENDAEFDVGVVGDFVRLMPASIQSAYLRELARVSVTLIMVFGTRDGHEHNYRCITGWSWDCPADVATLAKRSGLVLQEQWSIGSEAMVLRWQRASPA